jgi:DNA polymerase (family 10)
LTFTEASALVRSRQIQSDADLGPLLGSLPAAVDPGVVQQLRYMFEAGGWVLRESAIADLPADLRWLYESGAVTIEQLAAIHAGLGPTSAADLLAEVRRHSIQRLPGFDASIEAAIAAALPGLRAAIPRIPLGRAVAIAEPILSCLREAAGIRSAIAVGSLRRGQDLLGDIEIVAPAVDSAPAFDAIAHLPDIARTLHRGPRRLYLLIDRVQVGVRCPAPETAGAALLHLTGSIAHIDRLRRLAEERGWSLEPEGLVQIEGRAPIADTEQAIYEALDLPWIPPEIRDGGDEIDAARSGNLPSIVSRTDIRGDLHMHTVWSDGRDSIEEMVRACAALSYQYLAITDHSPHSAASRNLSADGVKRQRDEIEGLRERYPQLTILHGCEVDILPDGRLDFPDRILERFDIVLASLHEGAGHDRERLFQRYLGAMRHPLVSVITHPTNRQMPHRSGYDLDFERLFAAAIETRTVIEIDGAPTHLDLNGTLARQAVAAGATISIDSDAHRAEMLERQMQMGILLARNGWVEPRHVLNTRPIEEVQALIAAKRRR